MSYELPVDGTAPGQTVTREAHEQAINDAIAAAVDGLATEAQLEDLARLGLVSLTSASGVDAITAALPSALSGVTVTTGTSVLLNPAGANTGPVTLDIGDGAAPVEDGDGDALTAGTLRQNHPVLLRYSTSGGGRWRLVSSSLTRAEVFSAIDTLGMSGRSGSTRPGRSLSAWVSSLAGAPEGLSGLDADSAISVGSVGGLGECAVITDAQRAVAPREPVPVHPGRVYLAYFVMRRTVDTADISGAGVRLALARLGSTYDSVGAATVLDDRTVWVASGILRAAFTFSVGSPHLGSVQFELPLDTVHVRPYVESYGLDKTDAVAQIQIIDVTEAATVQGVLDPDVVVTVAAAATQALLARDAAFFKSEVFSDTAEGLSETSEGDQFQVVDEASDEIIRFRHDAGPEAVEVARYPSAHLAREGRDAGRLVEDRLGLTQVARALGPTATLVAVARRGWLWQDVDRLIPATEDGDPVRVIGDQSGRGHDIVVPTGTPPVLRREGGNTWVEGTVDTAPLQVPDGVFNILRQNFSAQWCVDYNVPRGETDRVLKTRDDSGRFSITWSGSDGGQLRFRMQTTVGWFDFENVKYGGSPQCYSLTVDEPGEVVRCYPGGDAPQTVPYTNGTTTTPISEASGTMPVDLFEETTGGYRFYGIAVVGRQLDQADHDRFVRQVQPPLSSPEPLRLGDHVARMDAPPAYDLIDHLFEQQPGDMIKPLKPMCFQDIEMRVPVRKPGDPVRVVRGMGVSGLRLVAVGDEGRARWQTDGVSQWLQCDEDTRYRFYGLRGWNRNDFHVALRVWSDNHAGNTQVLMNWNSNSVSSFTGTTFAVWKSQSRQRYVVRSGGADLDIGEFGVDPGDVVLSIDSTGWDTAAPLIRTYENLNQTDAQVPSLSGTVPNFRDGFRMLGAFQGRFYGMVFCHPSLDEDDRARVHAALRQPAQGLAVQPEFLNVNSLWLGVPT